MSGTYNGTYTSVVTLNSGRPNVTIGPTGTINAYGLGGTYSVNNGGGSFVLTPIYGALFAPRGTVFTVTNDGLIESHGTSTTNGFDVGIGLGTPGTVFNTGTILGATGIGILDATTSGLAGYLNNSGQITGSIGVGVYMAKGSITNSGKLIGAQSGAEIRGLGQVTNAATGTIASTGTNASALALDSAGGFVGNAGLITGSYVGIALSGAGSVQNSGTITQTGTVSGNTYAAGIILAQGGNVTNLAGGLISGARGIQDFGASGYVDNASSINASKAIGVYFIDTGTVVNHGTITGAHRAVVDQGLVAGGTGVIVNYGLLQSKLNTWTSNGTIKTGSGVSMLGAERLTNERAGSIIGANGIYLNGNGASVTLSNLGEIHGTYKNAIVVDSSAYIMNSGSIMGANAGIAANAAGVTISNAATGDIAAGTAAGIALHDGGTVVNAGTISGGPGHDAVYLGVGNARLIIEQGSTIDGAVTAVSGGPAALELSTAATDAFFDMGGTVNGFGSITFDTGSDWTLEGNIAELGSDAAGITGFTLGDTIVLDGVTATSASFNSTSSALDLFNGGTIVDQLTMLGPYGPDQFQIADVAQGTEITLCFARGTRILTLAGERAVEDLRPGDEVVTWRSGIVPLKWIGYQSFAGPFLIRNKERLPVRILAGAFGETAYGEGVPRRDLTVSPGHAMLLGNTLVLAKDLVNGVTVLQDEAPALVEYFALELDAHDCVVAEGALSESYADGPGLRNQFHNAAEFYERFPDYVEPRALRLCAPRPLEGAALEAALAPVVARAAAIVAPGRLSGFVDVMEASGHVEGWAHDPANPELPVLLEIRVDGKTVGTALAFGYREDLRLAGIGRGCAKFSFDAPPGGQITVHWASDGTMLPFTDACRTRMAS